MILVQLPNRVEAELQGAFELLLEELHRGGEADFLSLELLVFNVLFGLKEEEPVEFLLVVKVHLLEVMDYIQRGVFDQELFSVSTGVLLEVLDGEVDLGLLDQVEDYWIVYLFVDDQAFDPLLEEHRVLAALEHPRKQLEDFRGISRGDLLVVFLDLLESLEQESFVADV